jgi:hypothetical protein
MSDPRSIDGETTGDGDSPPASAPVALDRIAAFLFASGAILLFLSVFLITLGVVEKYLQRHFEQVVAESIRVEVSPRPPGESIGLNLIESVNNSDWVRFWGVQVGVVVLARNGSTWLYVNGQSQILRYPNRDPKTMTAIHARLLPATATVRTSVEHNTMLSNSILIVYATILLTGFFVYNRRVVAHQNKVFDEARESRDQAASTARRIEKELDSVRVQLREVEPAKQEHREEIERLQSEQQKLRDALGSLAAREHELRAEADRVSVLEEDSRAREELLEEATRNLSAKNEEIRGLEQSLKRVQKNIDTAGGKSRASELLAKRMRTLYPNLEIDERAIDDIVALQDEATKLRAEDCIKRLAEDADKVGFRRKVGGIPEHLSIYELRFAGKRRVYYAKVQNGRFRVLVIGAKNTQRSDLDYIAKIPKGEIIS